MKKINLYSEEFDELKINLNASIEHVVKKLASKEFEGGDINLKIKIGFITDYKNEQLYKKPAVLFKVNTVLQKKSNVDGSFSYKNKELVLDEDGQPVLQEVKSSQIDVFEEDEEEWKNLKHKNSLLKK